MNRTLLLAGVAATLFAVNANAMDFDQYISANILRRSWESL